ncbi:unnamed protein product [Parnassius apollo]|uniref:(apollo) hypothetical protein n=1 Tax=Parnassius apollo TaxID=110799 RepID=A0A8S3WF86_PARAO|nr:unnamed protein product [Parnassius apollo]
MKSSLKEIDTSIRSGLSILPSADSSKIFQTSIREHLQLIEEHLGAMSSELRTMREQKQRAPSPTASSLATELAQTGEAATKPKKTYTRVAASPPLPKPNHTLIITSTDSKNTAENIIERIREALDTKKTGAKVDRVRKAKNQKVILSCNTKEDLNLVQNRVKTNKSLKVEVARTNNPLAIIRDVLSYHTDVEIVENILAQNKHLLYDVFIFILTSLTYTKSSKTKKKGPNFWHSWSPSFALLQSVTPRTIHSPDSSKLLRNSQRSP